MTLALIALLSLPAFAVADDKEAVDAAAKKLADATSYTFKGETKLDSAFGNLPQQIPNFEGKYQKETGLLLSVGERGDFFRKGDKNYVKPPQGEWTELEKAQLGGAGGQGNQNRQRGALMGRMMVKNMKAPHDEIKDLAKGFKEIKKDEKTDKLGEKDCSVYGGDLTEEAVKASPVGRMIQQFAAFGGGGGQGAELSGKGRAWIDSDGALLKYELVTKISIDFQGNPIEIVMTRSAEFSAVGKTKVEIPEALQKLLEAPPVKSEDKKD